MKQDLNDRAPELRNNPVAMLDGEPMPDPAVPAPLHPIGDFLADAFALFERRRDPRSRIAWPDGWGELNGLFGGGLLAGLHVLVGGTGSGKTQLALQLAMSATQWGDDKKPTPVPALFLALEADHGFADLVARLADLCEHGQKAGGWSGIYKGTCPADMLPTVQRKAREALATRKLYPHRLDPGTATPSAIAGLARRFRDEEARDRTRPALLVLDYIQRVTGRDTIGNGRSDTRALIGELSSTLRKVATEENLVILALSSTAREHYGTLLVKLENGTAKAEGGTAPPTPGRYSPERLVGLGKEAGEIEFDADSVLAIVKGVEGDLDTGTRKHWLAVAKQRAGRTGWAVMDFNGHRWAGKAEADWEEV